MAAGSLSAGRAPLVGRDDELERIQAALDLVLDGEGRLLLVSGEPGIGKTRLLEEVAALAEDQGALAAWGRVDDVEGAPPYWPWAQVLDAVIESADRDEVGEALGRGAGRIATLLPAVTELIGDRISPPPVDPARARFDLHQEVGDFLTHMSRLRPLVLVLDDMHWADVGSLELTRSVVARLTAAPMMVVVSYRSVDAGGSEPFNDLLGALARHSALERVALTGLSEPEVKQFVAQTIGLRARSTVVSAVHSHTEGNPFFVGELVKLLASEGALGDAEGVRSSPVPVGVRDVVRRRLAQLPEGTNGLLSVASALGDVFGFAMVVKASGLDEVAVEDALEPALAAGVIDDSSGNGELRFSHGLIRQSVYQGLSSVRRSRVHAAVAGLLAASDNDAVTVAHHSLQAASVLGADVVVPRVLLAAQAAGERLGFEQAEDLLAGAATWLGTLPETAQVLTYRCDVQDQLALLLVATRGPGATETAIAWQVGRELHLRVGSVRSMLTVMGGLPMIWLLQGRLDAAAAAYRELVQLGVDAGDDLVRLVGDSRVGGVEVWRGNITVASEHLNRARSLMPGLSDDELDGVLPYHPASSWRTHLALASWLSADPAWARWRREGIDLQPRLRGWALVQALFLDLVLAACSGTPSGLGLVEQAEDVAGRAPELGVPSVASFANAVRYWAIDAAADSSDVSADMEREVDSYVAAADAGRGGRLAIPVCMSLLATVQQAAGNPGRALLSIERGLTEAGRTGERFWEPELWRLRGELLATGAPAPRLQGSANALPGSGLRPPSNEPSLAEDPLQSVNEALALARTQGSKTLEHRAEVSLAGLAALVPSAAPRNPVPGPGLLSPRECELLALVGEGLTDKDIAGQLVISLTTVRSHLDRIRDKTGRRRRPELTRLAVELGLVAG